MGDRSRSVSSDLVGDDVRRRIESYGASHVGHVRASNEDDFVVASLQRSVQLRQTNLEDSAPLERLCGPMAYLYAVADGVGGVSGGRMASGLAVQTTIEYLSETAGSYHAVPPGREHYFRDPLARAVQRAHDRLLGAFGTQERQGPATTLTLALLVWPRVFLVHVGDSRELGGGGMSRVFLAEDAALGPAQCPGAHCGRAVRRAAARGPMSANAGARPLAPSPRPAPGPPPRS